MRVFGVRKKGVWREREGFAFLDLIWAGNDRSDSNKFVSLLPLLKKVLP